MIHVISRAAQGLARYQRFWQVCWAEVLAIRNVYLFAAIEVCEGSQRRGHQVREVFPDRFFDMYGFDFQSCLRTVCLAIDTPDQAIAVQQGQAEIAELAQWLGYVALDLVVIGEDFATALALDHQVVEG